MGSPPKGGTTKKITKNIEFYRQICSPLCWIFYVYPRSADYLPLVRPSSVYKYHDPYFFQASWESKKSKRRFWRKWARRSENGRKIKVLRMEFSIVEILSGLQESVFSLSRRPQVHSGEKSKDWSNFINLLIFAVFFRIIPRGPPWVGGTGAALL